MGDASNNVTINNNTVSNNVSILAESLYSDSVGGIAGFAHTTTINNNTISTDVSISAGRADVGGIIGYAVATTISGNTVSTNVSISSTSYNTGGIAGYATSVTLSSNIISNVSITAESNVGGLIGNLAVNSQVFYNVILNTSIEATTSIASGVVASIDNASVYRNFIAATVTAGDNAAGLVSSPGDSYESDRIAELTDNYFIGNISATNADGTASGGNAGNAYDQGFIVNSYSAATISANTIYGLSGSSSSFLTITASYFDNTLLTGAGDDAAYGKSTSALQTTTSATGIYADWDAAVWNFGTSSQYPVLKNLPITEAEQCAAINTQLGTSINCTY